MGPSRGVCGQVSLAQPPWPERWALSWGRLNEGSGGGGLAVKSVRGTGIVHLISQEWYLAVVGVILTIQVRLLILKLCDVGSANKQLWASQVLSSPSEEQRCRCPRKDRIKAFWPEFVWEVSVRSHRNFILKKKKRRSFPHFDFEIVSHEKKPESLGETASCRFGVGSMDEPVAPC